MFCCCPALRVRVNPAPRWPGKMAWHWQPEGLSYRPSSLYLKRKRKKICCIVLKLPYLSKQGCDHIKKPTQADWHHLQAWVHCQAFGLCMPQHSSQEASFILQISLMWQKRNTTNVLALSQLVCILSLPVSGIRMSPNRIGKKKNATIEGAKCPLSMPKFCKKYPQYATHMSVVEVSSKLKCLNDTAAH